MVCFIVSNILVDEVKMNKVQLLTASLITGVIATVGYVTLASDVSLQNLQSVTVAKPAESKIKAKIESQSTNLSTNLGTNISADAAPASEQKVASQSEPLVRKSVSKEKAYARKAPPPPIGSNQSRDARHSNHQAHGHEQAPVSQQRDVNAPAPPTGANQ